MPSPALSPPSAPKAVSSAFPPLDDDLVEETDLTSDEALPVDVEKLTKIPLFSALDRDAFIAVLQRVQLRPMRAGEIIIREGEQGDSMFAIAQGVVRVIRQPDDSAAPEPLATPAESITFRESDPADAMFTLAQGVVCVVREVDDSRSSGHAAVQTASQAAKAAGADRIVAVLSDGAFFGEMALLVGGPRLATVVAATDGMLLQFSRYAIEQIVKSHPHVKDVLMDFHKTRLLSNMMRSNPIFSAFTSDEKAALVEQFRVRHFAAGQVILTQGQEGSGLFVILRGKCEVFHTALVDDQTSVGFSTIFVATMGEGDVFGELSLLTDGIVTATVRTTTECVVLGLHKQFFEGLVLVNPEVRAALAELSYDRRVRTRERMAERLRESSLL